MSIILPPVAVVPVIIGPLQVLIAILPALLLSIGGLIIGMLKPSSMWSFLKLLWRQKIALLIIAGVVAGGMYLKRTYFASGGPAGAQVTGTDWPMFRGSPERRGANDTADQPSAGGINWRFDSDIKTFYASPAVVGNRIYVTGADKGPMTDRGAIYCIDADSGALVWKAAPRGYLATFSSPSVAGKYLVCGEGLHETKSARVVCLDVEQGGKTLWTYETHSHVESTPCIDKEKGRVYVGAGDDGYYCFQLEPDAEGKAKLLWHAPTERCPDAETSPSAHDGLVFVGLGMNGNGIAALNADTGEQVWRVKTPYPVFGPPTVVNGSVIVGMGNGNFIESAEEVKVKELEKLRKAGKSEAELAEAAKTLGAAGEIWCLEEKTGKVQWTHTVPDTVLGAVAAATNGLYFGARDGYVYCLSPAGTELRKWNARAPLLTSPVLAGQFVYVVTQSGVLFGLRADDLERVWEARIGFVPPFISSPAVARGHVYVGSAQDGLLCLGNPGSQQREIRWAGFAGGPGCGGNVDGQPLPEKGKFAWRFPNNENAEQPLDLQITAPPACLNDALYVPVDGGRKGLLCVREVTDQGEARGSEVWFVATTNGVKHSPAATTNAVFFVDGQQGDVDRHLHGVTAVDGKVAWTLPVAADASGEFVLTDREGLIADAPGRLTAFELTGHVKWQVDCGTVSGVPVASDAMVVIATEPPAGIAVLDRASGRTLWRLDMEAAPTAAPLVRKHVIYLGTPAGVVARRLADGTQVWEAKTGAPGAPLVLVKNRIACTTVDGQMAIIDVESGAVGKTLEGALPGLPPLAALDSFVYATKNSLMVWPGTGEPLSWTKTDWLGRLTCAPVMVNSRIYVATDKKGLVCLKSK